MPAAGVIDRTATARFAARLWPAVSRRKPARAGSGPSWTRARRQLAIAAVAVVAAIVAPAYTAPARADDIPVRWLSGDWQQGSVIIGQVPPGSRLFFKGRELRLTDDGRFVFGLHRDEPKIVRFRLVEADGTEHRFARTVAPRVYEIQRIDGVDPAKVTPPPETLARIRAEAERVRRARAVDSARTDFLSDFIWPVVGPISGVFGSQRILNGQPRQPHYGVDVAVPTGTPVVAPAGGVVTLAEPDLYFSGGTLMIDHGHGLSSAFLHLSKILVKLGDEVRQGEPIAEVGATGRVTGPHLDWRVNWFEARVDAQTLVPPMDPAPPER